MENEKLGQGPAFPNEGRFIDEDLRDGMSKRFYAACAAMRGFISSQPAILQDQHSTNPEVIAQMSYEIADELLRQEEL